MKTILAALAAALSFCASAQDQDTSVGTHPAITRSLYLGAGVVPSQLDQRRADCVVGTTESVRGGATNTHLSLTFVSTNEQLVKASHLDAKADVQFLGFQGDGSYARASETMQKRDAAVLVLYASSEYRSDVMRQPALSPDARQLLTTSLTLPSFYSRCGTHFVSDIRFGSVVALVIGLSGLTDEEKSELSGSLGASVDWMGGSAGGGGKTSEVLAKTFKTKRGYVDVLAQGGGGLANVAVLVGAVLNDDPTPAKLSAVVTEYLRTFTDSNPAPLEYHLASMAILGVTPAEAPLVPQIRERRLRGLVDEFRLNERYIDVLSELKANQMDSRRRLLTPGLAAGLEDAIVKYENRQDVIARSHRTCRNTEDAASCLVAARDQALQGLDDELANLAPGAPRVEVSLFANDTGWNPQVGRSLGALFATEVCFPGSPSEAANCNPAASLATARDALGHIVQSQFPGSTKAGVQLVVAGRHLATATLGIRWAPPPPGCMPFSIQNITPVPLKGPFTDAQVAKLIALPYDGAELKLHVLGGILPRTSGPPPDMVSTVEIGAGIVRGIPNPGRKSVLYLDLIDASGARYIVDFLALERMDTGPGSMRVTAQAIPVVVRTPAEADRLLQPQPCSR